MIEFFVPGAPVPAGSKRVFMAGKAGGPVRPIVTDDVDTKGRGRDWRAAVRYAAAEAALGSGRLEGALRVWLSFFVPRPKSHRGKRGLLPSAPAYPTTKPDVLKLARAVEDACSGIVWTDDAQIVTEDLCKLYADGGASIGVRVRVEQLAARQAGAA
jgi:crossover junction endodeoxyribonuclease RusA